MSVYNKLYNWRSCILKISITLLRGISTHSVISPSRLQQVQFKRLHVVKNHLRLQLLHFEIRTMETDASLSSSNRNDSPDVESPKYRDVGTQRDFKSKEDSFFVPKQCFSGSEESDTETSDGKDDKDNVVESIEEEGEGMDVLLKGNEEEAKNDSLKEGNEEDTKPVPMDVLPDEADPDKPAIAEEDGAAHSSDKVTDKEVCLVNKQPEKRKLQEESEALNRELKKKSVRGRAPVQLRGNNGNQQLSHGRVPEVCMAGAKLETKALKAKRPGFTDERYNETSYYIENGLRKVYPYYFTFTTFTKGRWVGEKILDVFAREFRAHPPQEYERCIKSGTLTVNYEKVDIDYKLKHNDLLANVVHRHEVPVSSVPINIIHLDEDIVVVNKPASIPVHPCGRYRHNTVVFILAKEYQLKNLRTIHRLDRLTSGLLLFGRTPKKARQMEQQIRNRMVQKEYVCRVDGQFPSEVVHCSEPIEVVSYKIGVCKVSPKGKECTTTFHKLGYNPETNTSVVLCQPHTGRMHQIRVHLQYLGYPVVNDPLYNHEVFGPERGRGGNIGKTDEQLIRDLISIHNAENWLGMDGDTDPDLFKPSTPIDDELDKVSRECSPEGSPPPAPPLVPSLPPPALPPHKVTVATQTGHETPDLTFDAEKLTTDPHCYECKVRYRDPKPRDLVMYLHAFKYQGPGWSYQTELPEWARVDWVDTGD